MLKRSYQTVYSEYGATPNNKIVTERQWKHTVSIFRKRRLLWALADWYLYGQELGMKLPSQYAEEMASLARNIPQNRREFPASFFILQNLMQLGLTPKHALAQVAYMQSLQMNDKAMLKCSRIRLWTGDNQFQKAGTFPHVRRREELSPAVRRTLHMVESLALDHILYVGDFSLRFGWNMQGKPKRGVPCALLTHIHKQTHYIVGLLTKPSYFPIQAATYWLLEHNVTYQDFKDIQKSADPVEMELPLELIIQAKSVR